jgi:hypothetical protein
MWVWHKRVRKLSIWIGIITLAVAAFVAFTSAASVSDRFPDREYTMFKDDVDDAVYKYWKDDKVQTVFFEKFFSIAVIGFGIIGVLFLIERMSQKIYDNKDEFIEGMKDTAVGEFHEIKQELKKSAKKTKKWVNSGFENDDKMKDPDKNDEK